MTAFIPPLQYDLPISERPTPPVNPDRRRETIVWVTEITQTGAVTCLRLVPLTKHELAIGSGTLHDGKTWKRTEF